jgi:hypothetical protein
MYERPVSYTEGRLQRGMQTMTAARTVADKRRKLHALRKRIRPGGLEGLESSQRIDITYTSNAIEGNTLTAGETALVLEKGITVSGKPLKDHLEAIDHARALDWVLEIASQRDTPITEADIRNLHQLVVAQSSPDIAGRYGSATLCEYKCRTSSVSSAGGDSRVDGGVLPLAGGCAQYAGNSLQSASGTRCNSSVHRRQRPHGASPDEPCPGARRLPADRDPSGGSSDLHCSNRNSPEGRWPCRLRRIALR